MEVMQRVSNGVLLVSILALSIGSIAFNQSFASQRLDVSPEFLSIKIPRDKLKNCEEYVAKTIHITNTGEDSISNITIRPDGEWSNAMNVQMSPSVISLTKTRPEEHPTGEVRILITPTGKTLEGTYNGKILIQSIDTSSVSVVVSVPHTPRNDVNACGEGHIEQNKALFNFSLDLRFDTKQKENEAKAGKPFTAILDLENTGDVPLKNTVAEIILDQGLSTSNSKINHPQLIKSDDHALFKWKVNAEKSNSDFKASITVKVDTLNGSKSITKEIKVKH